MEANRSRSRWTWSEFARLPSEGNTRYEVIAGELAVTPTPSLRHQRIATEIGAILHAFVRERDLGQVFSVPVDVLFAEGDYLEPDLVFIRKARFHLFTDRGIEGPPDLVVEILSPSTAARDRGVKLERYRHFGVREYWIVDPDARAIEVWRLGEGAADPEVAAGGVLRWTPVPEGPTLALDVGEVLDEG